MKKQLLSMLTILALTPFLVQCASQNDVNKLQYQIRIVNKKIDDMKVDTVGKMQKRQAASSSQLDEVKKEVLILKGQLEETAHLNRLLREQNKELEASFELYSNKVELERKKALEEFENRDLQKDEKLSELEAELLSQKAMVSAIQKSRIKEAEKRALLAAKAAEEAKAKAKASSRALAKNKDKRIVTISPEKKKILISNKKTSSPPVEKPRKTTKPVTNTKNLIEQADQAYAGGDFPQAYKYYEKFTEKHPDGDKQITARFMMGECLFYQKEYDQAILQFQKIISNHPRHPRAASALLKQGMAFEKLSDIDTAKIIYKKILTVYSASPEAATAKERSANLK